MDREADRKHRAAISAMTTRRIGPQARTKSRITSTRRQPGDGVEVSMVEVIAVGITK
jgi:hypothetical protein